MASNKELTLPKHSKFSNVQMYMLVCVFAASLVLGITLALLVHFVQQISFNSTVLAKQESSIVDYSTAIQTTGICTKPENGKTYSDKELDACDPDKIDTEQVKGSLREKIMTQLASNDALNSVPKETSSICYNNKEKRNYTFKELQDAYKKAEESENEERISSALIMMKSCSALRIIPDTLPAYKNEEALLASLNKLFLESNWEPESLSPGGEAATTGLAKGLGALSVRLGVEADTATTMRVLLNIERSIREFNIENATIEWSGEDTLSLSANATAYYMNESLITQGTETIRPGGKQK